MEVLPVINQPTTDENLKWDFKSVGFVFCFLWIVIYTDFVPIVQLYIYNNL